MTHTPNLHPGGAPRRRTLLRCPLGNHKGHFELQRFGKTWGCAECVRLAGRQFVGLSIAQTAKAEGGGSTLSRAVPDPRPSHLCGPNCGRLAVR